jgi:hypothetical protein
MLKEIAIKVKAPFSEGQGAGNLKKRLNKPMAKLGVRWYNVPFLP